MPTNRIITAKEKALIALGASVAAGCQPCTEYHVRTARAAGACEKGIALSVETALAVRDSATRAMDRWAERCQESRPGLDAEFRAQTRPLAELISITAAVCVNSVADLTIHLAAACEHGASVDDIRIAIGIARAIKKIAEEKLETSLNSAAECAEGECQPRPGAMINEKSSACGCR